MRRKDAEKRFRQADDLFRAGENFAALRLLREVDDAFPGQPRILFPIALCLERLEEYDEAIKVFERLADQHFYDKARRAADRVRRKRAEPANPTPVLLLSENGDSFNSFNSSGGSHNSALDSVLRAPAAEEEGEEPHEFPLVASVLTTMVCAAAALLTLLGYLGGATGAIIVVATGGYLALLLVPALVHSRLEVAPLQAKGRALAGASAQVKGVMPAPPPSDTLRREPGGGNAFQDWKAVEARVKVRGWQFYFVDVVVSPPARGGSPEPWLPSAVRLIRAGQRLRSRADIDAAFPVYSVRLFKDGQWLEQPDALCTGAMHLRLHVAIDPSLDDLAFSYYLETFGPFRRSGRSKPAG